MPIEVFQIENLYGSNENYEFPNSLPIDFVDQNTFALRPRMSGYFSGTIALTGGHGNFCKYKGIYFQLRKVRLLHADDNEKKQRGQYALVRDMWVNTVLTKNVRVIGDLSTWNLDPELEANINKTFWMIEKPVEVFRTPFKKSTLAEGNSALKLDKNKVQEITLKPKQFVVSKKLHDLLDKQTGKFKGFQEASKHLYPRRKDIYIFGFIEPTLHPEGGKQKVINRINAELKKIVDDPQRQVVKVTTPASTKLVTHYAISYKDQRNIGTAEDAVIIEKIDLSKVTDIKEVQGKEPDKEVRPTSLLNEQTAIFDIEDRNEYENLNTTLKLARQFYAPFSIDSNYFVGKVKGYEVGNNMKRGWATVKGQKVEIKDLESLEKTHVGYFYGLDRIDFFLTGYSTSGRGTSATNTLARVLGNQERLEEPVLKYLFKGFGFDFFDGGPGAGVESYSAPGAADTTTTNKEMLGENLQKLPGYGVLMYQTKRDYFSGERCEYLGDQKLNSLQGYSGIDKNKFNEVYSQKNKGWSNLSDTELSGLCGYEPLSKFFLDLDYFLFFHFVPQPYEYGGLSYDTKGYFYYDVYKVAKFLKNYPYTFEYSFAYGSGYYDGGDPVNNRKLSTPFKESLYPNESVNRSKKIDKVLLKSNLDLPINIEKGDFFASSLEYQGHIGNPNIGQPNKEVYEGIKEDPFTVTCNTLEDFTGTPKDTDFGTRHYPNLSHFINQQTGKAICICSNYKAQIEVRELTQFTHTHELSSDPVQAVVSVDDGKERQITYGHLKKLLDVDPTAEHQNPVNNILAYIYKSLGYNTDSTEAGGDISTRWNGLTDEDLKSREGHLFDLVDSDGYVFLRGEDQVHFIYKHASVKGKGVIRAFGDKQEENEISTLDFSKVDERLSKASLTAKANQINVLMFKNEAIPIKSKFLFTGEPNETPFFIRYKTMLTDLGHSMTDNFFFEAKGDWDFFDQVITVPKRPSKIDVIGDQIQFEQLKLSQSYEKERYGLKKQFLALNQKLVDIHAQRAEGDLNFEDQKKTTKHYLRLAGSVISAATSVGSAAGGIYKGITAARAAAAGIDELDATDLGYEKDKKALEKAQEKGIEARNKAIKKLIKPSVRFNNAKSIASRIIDYQYGQQEKEEKVRRIQEDRDVASQQVALNTMGVDLSHFEAMRQRSLSINALSNQYYQDTFNERAIVDAWVEEKKIGGDIYLITMIPSEAQLKYIEDYKKHYGVQCEIPDQKIILRSGMKPNVIRFRNIDEGGIQGIDDLIEREGLKNRLLAQVKIVGEKTGEKYLDYFDHQTLKPIVIHDATDEKTIEGLKVGLEETKKLFDIFKDLQHDHDDEEKLRKDLEKLEQLRAEIEQKAEQIKGEAAKDPFLVNPYGENPTDVIDRLIKLTRGLLGKFTESKEAGAKCDKAKAELQKTIEQLQKAKDAAEDERDKCREETAKAHNKERELLNRAEEAERNVAECQKKIAEHEETKKRLEGVEKELEEKDKELTQAKEDIKNCQRTISSSVAVHIPEGAKKVEHGTYFDFLRAFKNMNGDYRIMYKTITETPNYGLHRYDLYVAENGPYFMASHGYYEELQELELNNTSFMKTSNENTIMRSYIMSEQGAPEVRGLKRAFLQRGAKAFSLKMTKEEFEKRKKGTERNSRYVYPASYYPYKSTEYSKPNWPVSQDSIIKKGTYGSKIKTRGQAEHFDITTSFEIAVNTMTLRFFTNNSGPYAAIPDSYGKPGNVWYNSFAYYDGKEKDATVVFLAGNFAYEAGGSVFNAGVSGMERRNHNLNMKIWGDEIIYGTSNRSNASIGTDTFSDRRNNPGYVLTLLQRLNTWKSQDKITEAEFRKAITELSPGSAKVAKWLLTNGSTTASYGKAHVLIPMIHSYYVLCEDMDPDEAKKKAIEEVKNVHID